MLSIIICLLAPLSHSEILRLPRQQIIERLATPTGAFVAAGTVLGLTAICLQLACIIRDGKKMLTSRLDILQIELQKVKTDSKLTKRDIEEEVTKRMK